jgi:hypothetical protein
MRLFVIFLILYFEMGSAFSKDALTLHFDPAVVELMGVVEAQTFPGPPNYESIQKGDSVEKSWYLRLFRPVMIIADNPPTDLGWKTERGVRVLQMAIDYNRFPRGKLVVGKKVRVKGKLFNRQTGHHHSRVLIDVSDIQKAD